jgi:hypothetical protein
MKKVVFGFRPLVFVFDSRPDRCKTKDLTNLHPLRVTNA